MVSGGRRRAALAVAALALLLAGLATAAASEEHDEEHEEHGPFYAEEAAAEGILAEWDEDGDGFISVEEAQEGLGILLGELDEHEDHDEHEDEDEHHDESESGSEDHDEHEDHDHEDEHDEDHEEEYEHEASGCQNGTALVHAFDADGDGVLALPSANVTTGGDSEAAAALSGVVRCLASRRQGALCLERATVVVAEGGMQYECTPPHDEHEEEHEDEHDEHEHRRKLDGHEDEHAHEEDEHAHEEGEAEGVIRLTSGTNDTWTCRSVGEVAAEEAEEVTNLTEAEQWLFGIIAVVVVCLCSLIGIFFTEAGITKSMDMHMSSLAVGAILGGTFFHILPEAIHTERNGEMSPRVTIPLLAGIVFVYMMEHTINAFKSSSIDKVQEAEQVPGVAMTDLGTTNKPAASDGKVSPTAKVDIETAETPPQLRLSRHSVIYTVLLGDGFHNIVDGLLIGTAFSGCTSAVGWAVTGGIILHEVPHEVSDFYILRRAGLSVKQAMLANFASACTAFIGFIFAMAVQRQSEEFNSMLLSFSVGIFLFLGASDILPELVDCHTADAKHIATPGLLMVIGMTVVALTTLIHPHCAIGGGHEGHDH